VPHSAVRNATEGGTRKFQIMDVSKDNIVLKEVGNTYNQGIPVTPASAKVPENAGVYSKNSNIKDNAQVAAEDKEAVKNIAILTGEDYESIEKEEGSIEDCKEESLERAAQRVKEQKEWKEFCQESNKELCRQLQEGLESIQKQGFLDQKSESQIAQILREADIPATLENISRVVSALQMSQTAWVLSDNAKSYIIGNGMTPTIENIYHGQYSGSDAYDLSVYDQELWGQLKGQIGDIIELAGLGIGSWIKPRGGYFISFEAMSGCAKSIVAKCKQLGLVLTDAGATYPYGKDPADSNIRIAPSFPTPEEMAEATRMFVLCVKLASIEKLLEE